MISFVRGELVEVIENVAIVDVGGIGYNVEVPMRTIDGLQNRIGEEIRLFTYLNVREDAMKLCGFSTREELTMFKMLIGTSGVGPKAGLALLSTMTPEELSLAIVSEDDKTIAKTPGIAAKTAQKIIVELKSKVGKMTFSSDSESAAVLSAIGGEASGSDARADAIAGLVALGFSNTQAVACVRKVEYTSDMTSDDVLKQALKFLSAL